MQYLTYSERSQFVPSTMAADDYNGHYGTCVRKVGYVIVKSLALQEDSIHRQRNKLQIEVPPNSTV